MSMAGELLDLTVRCRDDGQHYLVALFTSGKDAPAFSQCYVAISYDFGSINLLHEDTKWAIGIVSHHLAKPHTMNRGQLEILLATLTDCTLSIHPDPTIGGEYLVIAENLEVPG
ncbi:MAG: hypothetical protein WCP91_00965 [Candidatus Berkelbacteria bacterium]